FQKSGIWPINHNLFTNADYAPSISTSSTAHNVSKSYPICVDDEDLCQLSSDESSMDHSNANCNDKSSDDKIIESDVDRGELPTSSSIPSAAAAAAVPIPPS
ncbi:hypothetical protein APHAL10511_001388, partial [Amanita phalloides]